MNTNEQYMELIEQAREGDEMSRNRLAERAGKDLEVFVYRITLQRELAQDVAQETLIAMFERLEKFGKEDNIWGWLRRVASNKVADDHQNRRRERETIKMFGAPNNVRGVEHLAESISEELKQAVLQSMEGLKVQHRKILVLRCYEDMRFAEIAEVLGGSEIKARMLFWRAKKALQKKLSGNGITKGTMLGALVLFGRLTAPSKAAAGQVAVAPAALKVGTAATVAGAAGTTTGILSMAATGMLAVSAAVVSIGGADKPSILSEPYQGQSLAKVIFMEETALGAGEQIEEMMYYYPNGPEGTLMLRMKAARAAGENGYCRWLQNNFMNYGFDRRNNTVYIYNGRYFYPDGSVMRLPTDSEELTEALNKIEGWKYSAEPVREDGAGLCVTVKWDGEEAGGYTSTTEKGLNNIWSEQYFQFPWRAEAGIEDKRDVIHQRGWVCFRVEGEINGKKVKGKGQIPLVWMMVEQCPAWLRLKVGGEAVVSSFWGLGRPWMGLHTIDTVRRDAAQAGLWFETRGVSETQVEVEIQNNSHAKAQRRGEEKNFATEAQRRGEEKNFATEDTESPEKIATNPASLKLRRDKLHEWSRIIYTIDMEKDWIVKIRFIDSGGEKGGELRFEYLEGEQAGSEFSGPRQGRTGRAAEGEGMRWLLDF